MIGEYYVGGMSGIEAQLEKYGNAAAITEGDSMRPLFKTKRDMIVLKSPEAPPKKYDVVLYKAAGNYTMHRIIGIMNGGDVYVIRGDNTFVKEYVPSERVIAVLTAFTRKGKEGSVDAFLYKVYSRVWHYIYPVRFLLRIPGAAIRKSIRAVKRLGK